MTAPCTASVAKSARPTIVTIPCFSGAPWNLEQLTPLADWPLRTMALPDGVDNIEAYADHVVEQIADLEDFVLVGDSFGAVVSGGLAANPVTSRVGRAKLGAARFPPRPLYRQLTLRLRAASLASPYDAEGDYPLSEHDTADLFRKHTRWRSYTARAKAAAFSADYRGKLPNIDVPTLILAPGHDTLIGEEAAAILRRGIPDSVEQVLPRTGHMFRFTHPVTYSQHLADTLSARLAGADPQTARQSATAPAGEQMIQVHRHSLPEGPSPAPSTNRALTRAEGLRALSPAAGASPVSRAARGDRGSSSPSFPTDRLHATGFIHV